MAPLQRFLAVGLTACAIVTALPSPRVPEAVDTQHQDSIGPQRSTTVSALHQPYPTIQQPYPTTWQPYPTKQSPHASNFSMHRPPTSSGTHPPYATPTHLPQSSNTAHPPFPTTLSQNSTSSSLPSSSDVPAPPPAAPERPVPVGNSSRIDTPGTTFQAAVLHDRSVLIASTTRTDGVEFLRSNDSGRTWQRVGTIGKQTGNDTMSGMSNPTLSTFLTNGTETIYCAYEINHRTPSGVDYRQIDLSVSTDGGRSWTYRSSPAADPESLRNSSTPFLRTTVAGELQLYYSFQDGNEAENQVRISKDGGLTWPEYAAVSGDEINSIPFMHVIDGSPSVVVAPQSREITVAVDSDDGGVRSIAMAKSLSNGRGFLGRSTPKLDTAGGASGYAPSLITVGGTMVLGYQALPADAPQSSVGRGRLVTSTNDGSDWANGVDVAGGSPYISLLRLDDHTFICFALDGARPGITVQTYRID